MPHYPQRFWLAAFLVAWGVDFLFWGKPVGISFMIFVIAALAGGFLLARFEKTRPHFLSLALCAAVFLLAAATLLRTEPFTRFINGFLALVGLALLVRTFKNGSWIRFRVLSYIVLWVDLFYAMLTRAARLPLAPADGDNSSFRAGLRRAVPVLRGLLLALPVVVALAALLAAADLVFANQLDQLLKNFDLARAPEYLLRFFLVMVMAYMLAGLYLQALLPASWLAALPGDEKKPAPVQDSAPAEALPTAETAGDSGTMRFLGATEAFVVLGSVDLLFAFFVAIQFRYFFGGRANIHLSGYTFSEYARRGFFELVFVAVISLLLYLVLNAVTRRKDVTLERVFTALSTLLVGLVLVILVSAFQRLLLYEDAYGFTNLRMYTHIFIPWLGLLLVLTIGLQIINREQFFGAALLLVVLGFSLSFAVINVDGLIARLNIGRAQQGKSLDGAYLVNLSDDALPELARSYNQLRAAGAAHDVLGAVLACRVYRNAQEGQLPWQSYHPGSAAARQQLAGVDLAGYPVLSRSSGAQVDLKDGPFLCYPPRSVD